MLVDVRLFLRLCRKALFETKGTPARLTPKRIAVLLLLWPAFLIGQAVTWSCFLLDEIFFRGYRKVDVREPVFIVGVPRSGTTFLHRLLARDEGCTSMAGWEILYAPSIVQRKFWRAVGALDRRLGGPLRRGFERLERRLFADFDKFHKLSLFEPEEDDGILLNVFASIFVGFAFPFPEELRPFAQFDTEVPAARRARIMGFYRRMVQKHLYVHGPDKRFLSKNPAFSPKVETLREVFPDAKVICTVRSPAEMLPSFINLMSAIWGVFGDPPEPYPYKEFHLEMAGHWYRYPVARLDTWPASSQSVVVYDSLVADPEATVKGLYARFGFALSETYAATLARERARAKTYRSAHEYSLEQFGLTRERVMTDYRDIFERFGFDNQGQSPISSEK